MNNSDCFSKWCLEYNKYQLDNNSAYLNEVYNSTLNMIEKFSEYPRSCSIRITSSEQIKIGDDTFDTIIALENGIKVFERGLRIGIEEKTEYSPIEKFNYVCKDGTVIGSVVLSIEKVEQNKRFKLNA